MKVAGGLLMVIGAILAILNILYYDTGRANPLTICCGIVLLIIGIVIFNIKPKNKKD